MIRLTNPDPSKTRQARFINGWTGGWFRRGQIRFAYHPRNARSTLLRDRPAFFAARFTLAFDFPVFFAS